MERLTLNVLKLDETARLPTASHLDDAGLDLYSLENVHLLPNQTTQIRTGIAINIPKGYVGQIVDRSSMALKGLSVGGGIIDCGYSGEVKVILHNLNDETYTEAFDYIKAPQGYFIKKGDRIAQILIKKIETQVQVVEVIQPWESERGLYGFGSSGQ